jgi:hypothetical protein
MMGRVLQVLLMTAPNQDLAASAREIAQVFGRYGRVHKVLVPLNTARSQVRRHYPA